MQQPAAKSAPAQVPGMVPEAVCLNAVMWCVQALALEFGERTDASHDGTQVESAAGAADSTFYEITIATVDQPKLLSRLSDAMVRLYTSVGMGHQQMQRCFECHSLQLHGQRWNEGRCGGLQLVSSPADSHHIVVWWACLTRPRHRAQCFLQRTGGQPCSSRCFVHMQLLHPAVVSCSLSSSFAVKCIFGAGLYVF